MKVFVTVGLERKPFDRLLRAVDNGISKGVFPKDTFMQIGYSTYAPRNCSYEHTLPFHEWQEKIANADIVLSHAGIGSCLVCLRLEKALILFPRLSKLGEHFDDHQVQFARVMKEKGQALTAFTEEELYDIFHNLSSILPDLTQKAQISNDNLLALHLRDLLAKIEREKSR